MTCCVCSAPVEIIEHRFYEGQVPARAGQRGWSYDAALYHFADRIGATPTKVWNLCGPACATRAREVMVGEPAQRNAGGLTT